MDEDVSDARLRVAEPGDAAALLRLKQRLDQETSFMLLEASEREASVPALAQQLEGLAGGSFRRNRATAYVVIGVLASAGGRGLGRGLLENAKRWAAAHGVHRLELTVMAHNTRAIRLYQRTGFSVEGRRAECLLVDGQFIDELYMAAVLPGAPA